MTEQVINKLAYIWTNPFWYVSIGIGFLINWPFALSGNVFASMSKWAVGLVIASIIFALVMAMFDNDKPNKWRMS